METSLADANRDLGAGFLNGHQAGGGDNREAQSVTNDAECGA
jgi:hypothetical protein